ncbi:MAG: cytidylate kinase-like family protein [Actinobacteria bacterium]|nr:cytidylate kinase-like family protein [Actinomycetota bacterium]
MCRVVTISASYGAGGSVVAPRVAQRLGLEFADRLIPASDRPYRDASGEQLAPDERQQLARGSLLVRLASLGSGFGLPVPEAEDFGDQVRNHVEESIQRIARGPGGVILGRAAAIVLGRQRSAFHVRLDGPAERRLAQAVALEGVDRETAQARQVDTDRARTRYVSRLYGYDPADPAVYHLVLDSTAIPFDGCVEVIATAAEAFWNR